MEITADLVKKLRERTNAGMMECKKALVSAEGDIEAAVKALRESGIAKADKKAGRTAAEGIVIIRSNANHTATAMIEINCETDFVGRDENFLDFADKVANLALNKHVQDEQTLLHTHLTDAETVEAVSKALIMKLGEKIQVRRVALLTATDGVVGGYSHGGRIGVIVHLKGGSVEIAKDVAMHIAASRPQVVAPQDVSPAVIEKEREIFIAQAQDSGKPREVIEKMVQGRLNKFLNEISLIGQPFVKDPDVTVGDFVKKHGASVVAFQRFEVGEGIEKITEDFSEAVMAQVRGSDTHG